MSRWDGVRILGVWGDTNAKPQSAGHGREPPTLHRLAVDGLVVHRQQLFFIENHFLSA